MIVGVDGGVVMLVPPEGVGAEKLYGGAPGAVVGGAADRVPGVVVEPIVEACNVVADVLVLTELAADDGGLSGGSGELLGLLSALEMVIETVVRLVVVLYTVVVVVQGVLLRLGVEALTGVGGMLLSQEVSPPYERPGVARAGQMPARNRAVNIFAMMLGQVSGEAIFKLSAGLSDTRNANRSEGCSVMKGRTNEGGEQWRKNQTATVFRDADGPADEEDISNDYMTFRQVLLTLRIDGKQDWPPATTRMGCVCLS